MKINRCFHFLNMFAHLQEKISTTFILLISKSFSKYFCFSNLLKFGNFSTTNIMINYIAKLYSVENLSFLQQFIHKISNFVLKCITINSRLILLHKKNQNVHFWKIFQTNIPFFFSFSTNSPYSIVSVCA